MSACAGVIAAGSDGETDTINATFIGYAGAGTNTVNIGSTGRLAGDLLFVTAVGGSSISAPAGFTAVGAETSAGGGFRHAFWKISDGTETNITATNAGAIACAVFRGAASVVWLADGQAQSGGAALTSAGIASGADIGIVYAHGQTSSAGIAYTAPGAPVVARGQSAAGSFYRLGISTEPSLIGVIPTRSTSTNVGSHAVRTFALMA